MAQSFSHQYKTILLFQFSKPNLYKSSKFIFENAGLVQM